jgi:putative ABC transport system permease protein
MFFADGRAIGRRIRLAPPGSRGSAGPWLIVVGVAQTLPQLSPGQFAPEAFVYSPLDTGVTPVRFVSLIVRGRSAPAATIPLVREDVRAVDAGLPVFAVQSIDDAVARRRYPTRMIGSMFGWLAINALVLASVGIFALTAHGVVQRTAEIGIRIALGARAAQIAWLFMGRTLGQLAAGLTIGVAGAMAITRLLQILPGNVNGRDPITLASVGALLVVVTLTACFLPARRASRMDPVAALKHE